MEIDKNGEHILSLKDFDTNSMHYVNRSKERQQVMERNMKATQLILAAKKIKKERADADLREAALKLQKMKNEDALPLEAYIKVYDQKIKYLTKRTKELKELKDSQNGFLKQGHEKALADFSVQLEIVKKEKEDFIAKYNQPVKREPEEKMEPIVDVPKMEIPKEEPKKILEKDPVPIVVAKRGRPKKKEK